MNAHFVQMYKLFINNKIVYLCQNPAHVDNLMQDEFIIKPFTDLKNFQSVLKLLMSNVNTSNFILFGLDQRFMLSQVLSCFQCIEAAGGVVFNEQDEVLLIYRRGSWDLPKGKIEADETMKFAAIREVEEETGLKGVELVRPIRFTKIDNDATYHSYFIGDTIAMKVSFWYEMKALSNEILIPQAEEDIEEVRWVKKEALVSYFTNMYPSVIDVLQAVI